MLYSKEQLQSIWDIAKNDFKIQQIQEEWEWLIDKTVNQWDKPKNILEIGCYDGGSTYYLTQFAKEMVTMDWHKEPRFDALDLLSKHKSGGLQFQYVGGDSHNPNNIRHAISRFIEPFSFAFIDGDHSYEGAKADFQNIVPYLPEGCAVVFHDIVISDFHHDHGCYVGEFWRDLKNEYKAAKFEEYTTNPEWAGIGILWT